jgi:hypothetical protein
MTKAIYNRKKVPRSIRETIQEPVYPPDATYNSEFARSMDAIKYSAWFVLQNKNSTTPIDQLIQEANNLVNEYKNTVTYEKNPGDEAITQQTLQYLRQAKKYKDVQIANNKQTETAVNARNNQTLSVPVTPKPTYRPYQSLDPAISPEDRFLRSRSSSTQRRLRNFSPEEIAARAATRLKSARSMFPGLSDFQALDRYDDRMQDYRD